MNKVGCAGIIVDDIFCPPLDKFPDEGQLVAVDEIVTRAGGCAANVAISLARQGVDVAVAGCVGDDPAGNLLVNTLEDQGVDTRGVHRISRYPTSRTVILLIKNQDRRFIHTFGANKGFTVEQIDREWVKQLKVFYLGGFFSLPGIEIAPFVDLLKTMRQQNVTTVIDVVVPHDFSDIDQLKSLLPYVDYFMPNTDEATILTGEADARGQIAKLLEFGTRMAIVTCGEEGTLAASGSDLWHSGIFASSVVDPSGAGDAFAAGVIKGILDQKEIPQLLSYGAAMASSCVRAVGTTDGVFQAGELKDFLRGNRLPIEQSTL